MAVYSDGRYSLQYVRPWGEVVRKEGNSKAPNVFLFNTPLAPLKRGKKDDTGGKRYSAIYCRCSIGYR